MKRISIVAALCLLVGGSSVVAQGNRSDTKPAAEAKGVRMFEGTWSQVLAEAKRTGRPIYLDAYASWCGPCKMLKRDIFPREDVGAYFNANYISYSLDMEKGEGIELATQYNVSAYPTHLYFDPDGTIVHREVGGGTGDAFAKSFIEQAKNARDPKHQIYTAKRRFDSGDRDPEMLHRLALGAAEAGMEEAEYYALEYFRGQSGDERFSERNWNAIRKLATDFSHPGYSLLARHREEFTERYGHAAVQAVMLRVAAAKTLEAQRYANYSKSLFRQGDSLFAATTAQEEIRAIGQTLLGYHAGNGDWESYAKTAVRYVETGRIDNPGELNEIAWAFYEHVDDKAMLESAVVWAKTALDKDQSYAIADTYAAVLHKAGRKAEAEAAAKHAIELGKKEGADYAGTESLLQEITAEL